MLDEPNPNSPANSLAAQLYVENRREYEKRVGAIVEESWASELEAGGSAETTTSGKSPPSPTVPAETSTEVTSAASVASTVHNQQATSNPATGQATTATSQQQPSNSSATVATCTATSTGAANA